ncbi:MAG TPA: fatty acid desaturase [Acidimicrobiales bacterium]|nr:fatty acid desaturase [Acidimicrobiales bacterium]
MATQTEPRTMLPPPELLPDVLPTERLTATGRPVPPIREELRRIANARNALSVAGVFAQSFGVIAFAVALHNPFAYAAAYLLMGRAFALYAILGHEAAHRLLFTRKRWNDTIGRWLLSYPSFTAFDAYRRVHMAHHKDEMGPEEPDYMLYAPYPVPPDSMRRKLTRDAFFNSGYKNLKGLVKALKRPGPSRQVASSILGTQLAVAVLLTVTTQRWWVYPVLWLAPWMSVWKVINRLRAIAEHGGMTRSGDRRLTTHHVRQTRLARFWMVPFNTGWHLAHHVDIGIPFRSLPKLHHELVAAGWIVPDLEYPDYRSLWKALASG